MQNATLTQNFNLVTEKILCLEQEFYRPSNSVKLLAVSKNQSCDKILQLFQLGQQDFAENYPKEALQKISALSKYSITWHFIGTVQTNKAKLIACNFDWVHTIQRVRDIHSLCLHRPNHLSPLQACIQIKIDNAANKKGAALSDFNLLSETINQYPDKIQLRGLMGFAAKANDFKTKCEQFAEISSFFLTHKEQYALDTLSIGTSEDFDAAIKMQASMVRIGTALFGERK